MASIISTKKQTIYLCERCIEEDDKTGRASPIFGINALCWICQHKFLPSEKFYSIEAGVIEREVRHRPIKHVENRKIKDLNEFRPWNTSTWPKPPLIFNDQFYLTLRDIIQETILNDLKNVIADAMKVRKNLVGRESVLAIAMFCAVDAVAAYAFSESVGSRYRKFITDFFPEDYKPFARDIYKIYRNNMVHSWNLFQAGLYWGYAPVTKRHGVLSFGLIDFFYALEDGINNYLDELKNRSDLQRNAIIRYSELKGLAIKAFGR